MSDFQQAMERVLSRSKYDMINGKWDSLMDRLGRLINRILEFLFEKLNIDFAPPDSGYDYRTVTSILVIGVIFFVVILISSILYYVLKRKRKEKAFTEIFDDYRMNTLSFEELVKRAAELEEQKNFRQAVRLHYICLIMVLSQADIVYITDAMTGGQFMREIKANAPQFYAGVSQTVNMYYTLFFGNKSISDDEYCRYKSLYDLTIKEAALYE